MPGYWRLRENAEAMADVWNRRGDGRYEVVPSASVGYSKGVGSWIIFRVLGEAA